MKQASLFSGTSPAGPEPPAREAARWSRSRQCVFPRQSIPAPWSPTRGPTLAPPGGGPLRAILRGSLASVSSSVRWEC